MVNVALTGRRNHVSILDKFVCHVRSTYMLEKDNLLKDVTLINT